MARILPVYSSFVHFWSSFWETAQKLNHCVQYLNGRDFLPFKLWTSLSQLFGRSFLKKKITCASCLVQKTGCKKWTQCFCKFNFIRLVMITKLKNYLVDFEKVMERRMQNCKIYSWLSRCSTAKRTGNGFFLVSSTKVKAC